MEKNMPDNQNSSERTVLVDQQGVRFGPNCWLSHEQITGMGEEQLNKGSGIVSREYMRWLNAAAPAPAMLNGVEAGPLDRSAPPRVWLQVDTDGDNKDRSEAMPPEAWGELTWHHSPIGGQEVEYVRKDLIRAADNLDAAAVPAGEAVKPVAVVTVEPDFWSRGHFYEGRKPYIDQDCVRDLPIGTKLYTHPPAAEVREVDARAAKALLSARSHIGARRPDDEDDAAWWDELTELAAALSPPGREGV